MSVSGTNLDFVHLLDGSPFHLAHYWSNKEQKTTLIPFHIVYVQSEDVIFIYSELSTSAV